MPVEDNYIAYDKIAGKNIAQYQKQVGASQRPASATLSIMVEAGRHGTTLSTTLISCSVCGLRRPAVFLRTNRRQKFSSRPVS
jgi:hypothetical protein